MSLQYGYVSRKAAFSKDPGRLDRRIALLYSVPSRDAMGGEVKSWYEEATVWASKRVEPGRRIFSGDEKHSEAIITFRIRHRPDVAAFWRVIHGDDIYEIIAPPTELGRRHLLELQCLAIDQSTSDNRAFIDLGDGLTGVDVGDGTSLIDLGQAA